MREPYLATALSTVYLGDVRAVLAELPADSIDCVVTSPPYWGLRDYGTATWDGGSAECDHTRTPGGTRNNGRNRAASGGTFHDSPVVETGLAVPFRGPCGRCGARRIDAQIGLEPTPEAYVESIVEVMREVRRVLRPAGTLWLNLGDSYAADGKWGGSGDGALDARVAISGRATYPRAKRLTGLKPKDMVGIPWRVAFALQADGWYLRSDIIWAKPNPMPESVTDRPTKSHEYVFLMAKSERYYYDADAVREEFASSTSDLRKMAEGRDRIGGKTLLADDPLYVANATTRVGQKRAVGNAIAAAAALAGRSRKPSGWSSEPGDHRDLRGRFPGIGPQHGAERNRREIYEAGMAINAGGRNARTVWTIATAPYPEAHFATFPEELPRRCILAGCPADGVVLDPFAGSGTTLAVARDLGRRSIGIELSPEYARLIERRIAQQGLDLTGSAAAESGPRPTG